MTVDVAHSSEAALAQRPELRGMSAMRDEARAMARWSRREPYPDLMFGAWFNHMLMDVPPSFGAMVGVTLPIFSGPRAHERALAYDDRASAAEHDAEAMRAMIRAEVAASIARFVTASKEVELLAGAVIPKARESFDASLAGYGAATVDIVGVLEARRALQSAELALARARVGREIAWAQVERAIGGKP